MKEHILETLKTLRQYALEKSLEEGCEVSLFYHEEDSYLVRFANSAISLNTNEHLIRLEILAYTGQKRASCELVTDLSKVDEMKQGIDTAIEMVGYAQPLTYQPTIPVYEQTFIDESGYDPALAHISNQDRLMYFNQAVEGLESESIKLSGIFSNGANILAMINTRSEHAQYFCTSDAQVTVVLAHEALKWEVIAEQSAYKRQDLNPRKLHEDLAVLLEHYQNDNPQQLPLGKYSIVFGPAATAEMVSFMNWIGFSGGLMKRGYSMLSEEQVGQPVFSKLVNLVDDPGQMETFPFQRDYYGIPRGVFPIFQEGVFQKFTWSQDDADEFGVDPTGHTVGHKSLVLYGGSCKINTLKELINMPRDRDILYIPFLHYMNIVNPSKGIVTGSSRFGALLLKQDGSVVIPYNVRITQSLLDIFGQQIEWMSSKTVSYNTSSSYGARNPTAVVVPRFVLVNGLDISHSNTSY